MAREAEQPGWDIQFGAGYDLTAVEVKGTSGAKFPMIETPQMNGLQPKPCVNGFGSI